MDFFAQAYNTFISKLSGDPKKLTPAQIEELLERNLGFLEAQYKGLTDVIRYEFKRKKFMPELIKLTTPLTLTATQLEYKFTNYQELKDTILVDFCIPIYNSLTTYVDGTTYLSIANTAQAFLNLKNDRQQDIVFREPLVDYFRDTAYWQGKGKFNEARMDWDNSSIQFPAGSAIPAGNAGTVIAPVITYIDMKRYPYLK